MSTTKMFCNFQVYLAKIDKRVKEYKINEFCPPRTGKKLLVLDIDYTLFDHRSVAETGAELMRPYLHEFLTSAYKVSILCHSFHIFNLFSYNTVYYYFHVTKNLQPEYNCWELYLSNKLPCLLNVKCFKLLQ